MRLIFAGFTHTDSYARPPHVARWVKGEEREVSEETGEHLMRTFPGAFNPAAPVTPSTRRIESPRPAPVADPVKAAQLSAAALIDQVKAGRWDDQLDALKAAEQAGRGRVTVLRAIEGRR